MKKLLFILLVTVQCIAQNDASKQNRFFIEHSLIVWHHVYKPESLQNMESLRKNPNLIFIDANSGYSKLQKIQCKGIALYSNASFRFNFKIEQSDEELRVQISDITYDEQSQNSLGSLITANASRRIEDFVLRKSDTTILQNYRSQKSLQCLDNHFIAIFGKNLTLTIDHSKKQ